MPTLSLCMIVRDAEATLPACLESARGLADVMIIADTGSADRTLEVAGRYGARCLSIPWEDDFAKARNRALAEARSDWVLVLDADERLDPGAGRALAALLGEAAVEGFQVTIRNYVTGINQRIWDRPARVNDSSFEPARQFPAYIDHENVRLFRRLPHIRFVGRVHESVGPEIVRSGGRLGKANFLIHHFGLAADADARYRKNCLYRELGRKKAEEMPDNAQAHFELGLVIFDNFPEIEEALSCFAKACRLNPFLGVGWLFQGLALQRLGRHSEALQSLERAAAVCGASAMLAEAQGDSYYNLGEFGPARRCYQRALERLGTAPDTESKLGLAEVRAGRTRAGLGRLRRAVEDAPGLAEVHDRLIQACVWLDLLKEAAEAADRKLAAVEPDPQSFLRSASIHAQISEWNEAAEVLRAGLCRFPEAERLRRCLAEAEDSLSPSRASLR